MPGAPTPLRVAVTGATGLVGTQLCAAMEARGDTVLRVVRRGEGVRWDPAAGEIDAAALEGVDAVVHLAGAPIGRRWTPEVKRDVLESRARGTEVLCSALVSLATPPKVLVSASAVGWYGDRGDEPLDESSAPGTGFQAEVCGAWEAATAVAEGAGIRVVRTRLGVVISAKGGALPRMLTPFRLGLGGPVGSGRQWFPWVALDDVVGAILFCVGDASLRGPVNLMAPEPVRQREFARALGQVLGRPAVIPLPAPAVRVMFGEMGEELLLGGQRARPVKLRAHGYAFARPTLEAHLRAELSR
ncbi:MAG: TIGR01777 family oxidoreductase [Myxococcota bacterium]